MRALARFVASIFYRDLEIIGSQRVPASGPLIVAANHQNALVDPLLLVARLPRPLRPLAKSPLFKNPIVRPFLAAVGAVPVLRAKDTNADPSRNEAMFEATARALGEGEAILIFPEGIGHFEPGLQPLRTGTARMLLGARARGVPPVALLPVGLVFREPGRFRAGSGALLVGEAVPTADCEALYAREPEAAVRRLTDRLAEALRRQLVEADTWRTERLLRIAETIWREERGEPGAPRDAERQARFLQRLERAYRHLLASDPALVRRLRRKLEAYSEVLSRAGLRGRHLEQRYDAGAVARYVARHVGMLLLTLPLALAGMLVHATGFWLTDTAVRLAHPEPDVEATYKIFGGVLFYPLTWGAEAWVAWRLGGPWVLAAFLALLVPTGFVALAWRERLARAGVEARALYRYLRHPSLRRHLAERRAELAAELAALAEQVPAELLEDPKPIAGEA